MTFFLVALVMIVTPGPDTALTIRNALLRGRHGGVATAFGVVTGQVVWTLAAAAGVAALIGASHPLFVAVRVAGAAYLVWLGLRSGWSAWHGRHDEVRVRPGSSYREGLLSNLGNPKSAVFFTSLLPQFGSSFGALVALGGVYCAITLGWLSAVAATGALLRSTRVRRALDAVTAAVLVSLGLHLAAVRR